MATKRHEDLAVFVWDDEEDTICAWHERDKDPNGSHGICQPCAEKVKLEYKARNAVKALFQKGENRVR